VSVSDRDSRASPRSKIVDAWELDDLGQKTGAQLEPTGREVAVGMFRADIGARDSSARDSSGRLVIIENQHGPSDHGHFSQVLLYALESKADVTIWLVAADVLSGV
jgi:hypothetical protein